MVIKIMAAAPYIPNIWSSLKEIIPLGQTPYIKDWTENKNKAKNNIKEKHSIRNAHSPQGRLGIKRVKILRVSLCVKE